MLYHLFDFRFSPHLTWTSSRLLGVFQDLSGPLVADVVRVGTGSHVDDGFVAFLYLKRGWGGWGFSIENWFIWKATKEFIQSLLQKGCSFNIFFNLVQGKIIMLLVVKTFGSIIKIDIYGTTILIKPLLCFSLSFNCDSHPPLKKAYFNSLKMCLY